MIDAAVIDRAITSINTARDCVDARSQVTRLTSSTWFSPNPPARLTDSERRRTAPVKTPPRSHGPTPLEGRQTMSTVAPHQARGENGARPSGPRLVIEIAVEERPRVRYEAMSEAEEARLVDWITSHEPMRQLVEDARMVDTSAA